MASPQPPQPDSALAERTVHFLSRQIRLQEYRLHRVVRQRKELTIDEIRLRDAIRHLYLRLQGEIEKYPSLLRLFGEE